MRKILLLIFIFSSITTYCQVNYHLKIDSLNRCLKSNKSVDTTEIILLNELAFVNRLVSPEASLYHSREALRKSYEIKWERGIGVSLLNIGIGEYFLGNNNEALEYFYLAQNKLEKYGKPDDKILCKLMLADIFKYFEASKKPYEFLDEAQKLLNNSKNGYLLEILYYNQLFHIDSKDTAGARKKYEQIKQLAKNNGNWYYVAMALDNYCYRKIVTGNYTEAIEGIKQSANMLSAIGLGHKKYVVVEDIGYAFLEYAKTTESLTEQTSLLDSAKKYLLIAISLAKVDNSFYHQSYIYELLAKNYALLAQYETAYEYLDSSRKADRAGKNKTNGSALLLTQKMIQEKLHSEIEFEKKTKRNYVIFFGAILTIFVVVTGLLIRQNKKTHHLLSSFLPDRIAKLYVKHQRKKKYNKFLSFIKRNNNTTGFIVEDHTDISVLFFDIAGFTDVSRNKKAIFIVQMLDNLFNKLDALADANNVERIKTIGDGYMAVAGLKNDGTSHVIAVTQMALDIQQYLNTEEIKKIGFKGFRIGLDCGAAKAGVIGGKKIIYDVWGDAVNRACRMEQNSNECEILCTETFKTALEDQEKNDDNEYRFAFEAREEIELKGLGNTKVWVIKQG